MLEQQIEQDIKTAMLARDATLVLTLKTVKSVLLSVKVNTGKRDVGLTDEEVIPLLAKEAKKRQESADLYVQGGNQAKADDELAEKAIIETYLPARLTEAEISKVADDVIAATPDASPAMMGKIVAEVRTQTAGAADGALIAKLVKDKLAKEKTAK